MRSIRLMFIAILIAGVAAGTAACGSSGSSGSSGSTAAPGTPTATKPAATAAPAGADPLAGLTADQIATRALANTKNAPSVRLTGAATDSGQSIALDVTLVRGQGCEGTLSEGKSGSFRLISNGTTVWVMPDQKFYRSFGGNDPAVLAILNGKYLKVKASSSGLAELAGICSLSNLVGAFGTPTGLVKSAPATVGGQPVVRLSDLGDKGYVYVSDIAKPKLLQLNDPGSGGGKFNFGYPATTISIAPPPASEVLDGSKYGF